MRHWILHVVWCPTQCHSDTNGPKSTIGPSGGRGQYWLYLTYRDVILGRSDVQLSTPWVQPAVVVSRELIQRTSPWMYCVCVQSCSSATDKNTLFWFMNHFKHVWCILLNLQSKSMISLKDITSASYCRLGEMFSVTLSLTNEMISISTSQIFNSWVVIFHILYL